MCLFCLSSRSIWAHTPDSPTLLSDGSRRLFLRGASASVAAGTLAAAGAAHAQVDVGKASSWRQLVPADAVERGAGQEYSQLLQQARTKGALRTSSDPQYQMLQQVAQRLIPQAPRWNDRARSWNWEVNLIQSKQINAFCMPGGKIAFFTGILDRLQLSAEEAAIVLGHEMAHALREHAREQMAKKEATNMGASLLSQLLGFGNVGNAALGLGAQLLSLRYSRSDETEADIVGLELSARAAYDPNASVSLWKKMMAATGGGGSDFLSSHPSDATRIRQLQANIPKVQGLYRQAKAAG